MSKNNFNKTQILILMAGLVILGVSAIDIYIASLPQMVIEFMTIPAMINLTISAYTIGIAFAALFIGELSNRFGRRKILLAGVFCFAISSWLIAFSPSIYLIIILRVFQAIGCSSFIIIPRMIIRDTMDEKEQINATGILLLGMIISPAISPVFGAYISKYFGWRYCFGISGGIAVIMTYIIYKILPETNHSPIKQLATIKHYLTIYRELLSNSSFMALTTIYATTVGAYFGFIGISSYLYIDSWHVLPTSYSYIYVFLSGAYFAGNYIMRRLNRNGFPAAHIIGVGVYSAFIGVTVIAIASVYLKNNFLIAVVTIGVIFMRTSNAIIIAPTQIRVMNKFSPHSAQALGLNMCLGFISNSFATYIVTVLKFTPLINLMIISILPVLIGAGVYVKFRNKL